MTAGCMVGRVVVVTGATSGIGRAAALAIGTMGATVALVGRDPGRLEETAAALHGAGAPADVLTFRADLSSQRQIRELAAAIAARLPQVDVLLNNAGIVNLRRTVTDDGIESVFAVNHLAYFMTTLLLLDALRAAPAARVVNVASAAHSFGARDLDDLQSERQYRAMRVYGRSKLYNILFTYELARRLEGTTVTANCLHPGAVGTRLGQNNGRVATALTKMLRPFFRTPEQGAATAVYLATAPEVAGVSGRYFADRRPRRSLPVTYDPGEQRRLWEASERLTGVAWPGP